MCNGLGMRIYTWQRVCLFLLVCAVVARGQSPFDSRVTQSQLSRLDPKTESTSVLLETSKELLKNEQLAEAVPFLEEILVRLEGDDEKKARQTLAFSLYQLAYCQMKLGEYVSAGKNFIRFADEFPDDPQMESGRVLAAQCLTMVQQWPTVEEQAALVLQNVRLPEDLKIPATQLLSEACYQQEKWATAVKPLSALYRMADKDSVRSGAAVMLVTCYVRLNDFDNLFRFLPNCDMVARHNVGLNVALLEAGDAHYNAGEYLKALLLYRQVLLKKNLIAHYEQRLMEVKSTLKPFVAGGSQTLTQYKEGQRRQQDLFDRLKKQYDAIVAFDDYDMDVALRTAQCYNDLDRNWPAHAIYERIYKENPDSELADEARYSAFAVMIDEREWALAAAEGYAYLQDKPQGDFIDDITLNLMQVHLQQEQLDLAYDIGRRGLELSPEHKYIDQVDYLMGYIRFLSLDYEEALTRFSEVLSRWPDSRYYESAEYWRAMTLLFMGRFVESESAFSAYLSNPKYVERVYEEDASYRLGIAQYGAEMYDVAETTFRAFVELYPESTLLSEAYAMLGDLRAAEGELEVALDFYRLAREKARNIGQVNYPLFQAAKVLELDKRFADIVELMANYLKEYGGAGDYANAANWSGRAYKALDDYPHALKIYLDVVDAYGADAENAGVDVVLNQILEDYNSEDWVAYQSVITQELHKHLEAAMDGGVRTLELRYQTLFAQISVGEERESYIRSIVQSRNIPASGPSTLVLIAREGVKLGDFELVHEATARFMSNFEISNNMLYIMLANMDALIAEGSYREATELSEEILLKFGYSKSVGYARKRRGDAFRMQGKYEDALEAYKEVLAIREWRGPLTPEALYYSGICKMKLGEIEEAFAYFQRIYVLYEDYLEWVAPAYAKSIACMKQLGGYDQEIINTYKEMVANEAVAKTPEGQEAAEQLRLLEPAGEVL